MIDVTRAIVVRDGCVLAAQRPLTMSLPLLWELPGGKIEPDEDPIQCLHRETMEELCLEINVLENLPFVDRSFRDKHYRMHPWICEVSGGKMCVNEHAQSVWQPIDRLFELEWAPAEEMVLRRWREVQAETKATRLQAVTAR